MINFQESLSEVSAANLYLHSSVKVAALGLVNTLLTFLAFFYFDVIGKGVRITGDK